jgi:hypothetical protein
MAFPFVALPTPVDHDVKKIESTLYQKTFHVNMIYSGSVVLEKKIFKEE